MRSLNLLNHLIQLVQIKLLPNIQESENGECEAHQDT